MEQGSRIEQRTNDLAFAVKQRGIRGDARGSNRDKANTDVRVFVDVYQGRRKKGTWKNEGPNLIRNLQCMSDTDLRYQDILISRAITSFVELR